MLNNWFLEIYIRLRVVTPGILFRRRGQRQVLHTFPDACNLNEDLWGIPLKMNDLKYKVTRFARDNDIAKIVAMILVMTETQTLLLPRQ